LYALSIVGYNEVIEHTAGHLDILVEYMPD